MARLANGTPFGNYTIQGLIASGGMGEVYAAQDEVYGTTVALKVLHAALHEDASWRKRFNEEGLVGTQLKHPHVLSARELVESDGRIALVMDLISGGQTLDKVIFREHADGLPLIPALQVFLAIVQGIEYLHAKDIVHGDLKPENVMISGDYRDPSTWMPQVTDFGTVALIADPVTIDGRAAVVATPRYASPEHLYGVDQIEKRSDIYALGLILHFLLTGRHVSSARTVEDAARQVILPAPIVTLVDQPDVLISMFQRACAPDPEDRFQSCRELALAVREILDSMGAVLDLDDIQADLATEVDESRAALLAQQQAAQGDTEPEPLQPEPSLTEAETDPGEPEQETELGLPDPESDAEPAPPPPVDLVADDEIERTAPAATDLPRPVEDEAPDPPEVAEVADPAAPEPLVAPQAERVPLYVWVAGGLAVTLLLLVVVMSWPG